MIAVLSYHSVSNKKYRYAVTPEAFEAQLTYFQNRGEILTLEAFSNIIKNKKNYTGKGIVVTFDDGLLDFATDAYPVLKKLNIPATVFVPTGLVGGVISQKGTDAPVMSWDDIVRIEQEGLVQFESHAHTHRPLASLSQEEVEAEYTESKKILKEKLGRDIHFLCYPKGNSSEMVRDTARKHFDLAFGEEGIITDTRFIELFEIPRIIISTDTPLSKLRFMMHPVYWRLRRVRDTLRKYGK